MNDLLHQLDRRDALRFFTATSVLAAFDRFLPIVEAAETASVSPNVPATFKDRLQGAVLSIPTPFLANREIDFQGIERMIDRAIPHDIRIFSLTAGNSQYESLSMDEIYQLTSAMIKNVNGRGVTIAATGAWDAEETIRYAKFSEAEGADAVQVMRLEAEDDVVVDFFKQVAGETRLPIVLHGNFSHALLERLVAIESIVALKEDVGLEYYIQVQRKFGERLAIFEGGPEYAFLVAYPYGSRASYTTLGTFVPHITKQFWNAINNNDVATAYAIVNKYEHPFFDRWSHAFWRASLEHFGVAARYIRSPQQSFTDEQMRNVAEFYRGLGLS